MTTDSTLTLAAVAERLRGLGVAIQSKPGEYRVNYRDGKEPTAYYTDDLVDALATGEAMAAEAPAPPPLPLGPTGGRKSRKGFIIRHNRKLAARRIAKAKIEAAFKGFAIAAMLALSLATPAAARPVDLAAVCFTPGQDCAALIVSEITTARRSILLQAYSFTSAPIARALIDAKRRGVDVRAILDQRETIERPTEAAALAQAGIPVLIDGEHRIAHNKVMVIDGATVITGSYNFTASAERYNAENVLVIHDQPTAAAYAANWQGHASHSAPYP